MREVADYPKTSDAAFEIAGCHNTDPQKSAPQTPLCLCHCSEASCYYIHAASSDVITQHYREVLW
jgi:hypothetical protein